MVASLVSSSRSLFLSSVTSLSKISAPADAPSTTSGIVRICTTEPFASTSVSSGRAQLETEVEANGSVVQMRTIPLVVDGASAGALILLRDVTELRNRERELLTKDATIREIHHRVKNNLQTVAALLRLQARRTSVPEASG